MKKSFGINKLLPLVGALHDRTVEYSEFNLKRGKQHSLCNSITAT